MKYVLLVIALIANTSANSYDEERCKNIDDGDWPKYRDCVRELKRFLKNDLDDLTVTLISQYPEKENKILSDKKLMKQSAHEKCYKSVTASGGMGRVYRDACMNGKIKAILGDLRSTQW